MDMDRTFRDILCAHEREDNATIKSEKAAMNAIRAEFSNAEKLITQAHEKGFSFSEFLSGRELPCDMELPVRNSQSFYIKKHTETQRPYIHSHEFYEMVYVQSGECRQTLRHGENLKLSKGQCSLLRPGAIHRIERVGSGDVILKTVIPRELFERCIHDISLPEEELIVFGQISLFAEYLFIRLLKESHKRDLYDKTAIAAMLSLLLCELARGRTQNESMPVRFYDDYFRTELKQASLAHFARKYGYVPAYASRLIKQRTGKNFSELLTDHRLQRAAELLSSSDMNIEDIALEIGYKVPSALYKHFSAHFGMTPKEYRDAMNKR